MADDASITLRYPKKLEKRLFDVIAATEQEVTRSGLFIQAMELFLAQVEVCPSMVKNYDPKRDKSARQNKKPRRKDGACNAGDEDA